MAEEQARDLASGLGRTYGFEDPAVVLGRPLQGDLETTVNDVTVKVPLASLNKHGLIAGAIGTGKTRSLQVMVEQLSAAGVPVFLADPRGDLTGVAISSPGHPKIDQRMQGMDPSGVVQAPLALPGSVRRSIVDRTGPDRSPRQGARGCLAPPCQRALGVGMVPRAVVDGLLADARTARGRVWGDNPLMVSAGRAWVDQGSAGCSSVLIALYHEAPGGLTLFEDTGVVDRVGLRAVSAAPGGGVPAVGVDGDGVACESLRPGEGLLAPGRGAAIGKRALDVSGSLVLLVLGSPLMLGVAGVAWATSKGPVLCREERIGRDGRPFGVYGFTTMPVDVDHGPEPARAGLPVREGVWATGVGRALSRLGVAGLPQLVSVLVGRMSLVGPRPAAPGEVDGYTTWEGQRLLVKPGLTCVDRVSGRRDVDFKRRVAMDLDYIRTWTLGLDVQILGRTLAAVVRGRGAA